MKNPIGRAVVADDIVEDCGLIDCLLRHVVTDNDGHC